MCPFILNDPVKRKRQQISDGCEISHAVSCHMPDIKSIGLVLLRVLIALCSTSQFGGQLSFSHALRNASSLTVPQPRSPSQEAEH